MIRKKTLTSLTLGLAAGTVLAGAVMFTAAPVPAKNAPSAGDHKQTLQLYCVGCHSGPTPFAGLNLEPLDFANLEDNGIIWEKMIRKLRDRQMPPAGMPRPDDATMQA